MDFVCARRIIVATYTCCINGRFWGTTATAAVANRSTGAAVAAGSNAAANAAASTTDASANDEANAAANATDAATNAATDAATDATESNAEGITTTTTRGREIKGRKHRLGRTSICMVCVCM